MSKFRTLFLLVSVTLATGFISYQTGIISKPGFGVADRGDWDQVNQDEIVIESSFWINNQNPATLDLRNPEVEYSLLMNDIELAEGTKKGLEIDKGNQTVEFHTSLNQKNIQNWWVKHMKNSETSHLEVPVQLSFDIAGFPVKLNGPRYTDSVETDIEGSIDSSVSQIQGTYQGPKLLPGDSTLAEESRPEIEIVDAEAGFGDINMNRTQLVFDMDVKNSNPYPIPAPEFTGNLEMNSIRLAEWNTNTYDTTEGSEEIIIQSGEVEDISFRADIDNSKIDEWLTSHIRREENTQAEIEIKLRFEAEGISFTVPKGEGITCGFKIQTAILEDNQKPSSEFTGCNNPLTT
jgi:LEA14-like dessication related protein